MFVSKDEDVIYIKIFNFQFSFHSVGNSDTLKTFRESKNNVIQEWEGLRLQLVSSKIFDKAQELRE